MASLPFIIAGFSTPIFGIVISKIGETYYELMAAAGAGIIFIVHFSLYVMNDALEGAGPKYLAVIPIALFGVGHALFVTVSGPTIK